MIAIIGGNEVLGDVGSGAIHEVSEVAKECGSAPNLCSIRGASSF